MGSTTDKAISLQINLSPTDYPLCKQLLRKQISYFYEDVEEIILTVETKKSKGKKFGENFKANCHKLAQLLAELVLTYPKIRIAPVDYSPEIKKAVSKRFFKNTDAIPDKDYRGGPFYSYFFGLYSCKSRYVIHMDSDMFIGGKATQWIHGALKHLQQQSVMFVNPLPGPPNSNFHLKQPYHSRQNRYTYYFKTVTTRFYLTDLDRLTSEQLSIRLINPSLRRIAKGIMQRNFWELPEKLFSDLLKKKGYYRVCYWGENDQNGCFTLHPLIKPESFITNIPKFFELIDKNDFPESQRGWYNIHKDTLRLL
ncbi:hypothetical protein H8S95_06580 [Pontibacter sp. KCTC 32443]|uniref:hypothetical protein n=1 Tax=Pontibacter TaxID=323449 RepID=UPI00164DBD72|nr:MULTISPECIES: hypothetical protein [Pontibacter]MBC5773722.1 hypothetical protein [Pontibacter sp. KCTC 32443]